MSVRNSCNLTRSLCHVYQVILLQGMLFARGSDLLFADADGASRFSDLDLLSSSLDKIRTKDGHAVVLGSRAHLVDTAAVVQVRASPAE
jgi:hypothetical protein